MEIVKILCHKVTVFVFRIPRLIPFFDLRAPGFFPCLLGIQESLIDRVGRPADNGLHPMILDHLLDIRFDQLNVGSLNRESFRMGISRIRTVLRNIRFLGRIDKSDKIFFQRFVRIEL